MEANCNNLHTFLQSLKNISLWRRIFSWRSILNNLSDSLLDIEKMNIIMQQSEQQLKISEQKLTDLTKDHQIARDQNIKLQTEYTQQNISSLEKYNSLTERNNNLLQEKAATAQHVEELTSRKTELEIEVVGLKKDIINYNNELVRAKALNTQMTANEQKRQEEHSNQTATLKSIQTGIELSRQKELEEKHAVQIERLENLKLTWSLHQQNVQQSIKAICGKHTVEYIDKVSFKGEPDNTIRICGEYIIFDAKSPRTDDLNNFPNYIKEQTEKAKKYANEESVKKWIFFVVPSNTSEILKNYVYPLADYDVFIITQDSLEPVILSLKKIEEYEFADQLSPEDRDNICRVLGKFAHLSKRRIQIDTYFINQFMELAYKCESDLPSDMMEKIIEFEKAEKLNPPQEKRIKAISISELERTTKKVRMDARNKGILIEDNQISDGLNCLPLYDSENLLS